MRDSLALYFANVRRHDLVTPDVAADLARRARSGDSQAEKELVEANLRLVLRTVRRFAGYPVDRGDLIQEGNLGLIQAARHFDPERGVRFASYAIWWIRAHMLKHVLASARLVKLGTTQAQRKLFFRLRSEQNALAADQVDGDAKIAENLGVRAEDVNEMRARMDAADSSLDAPIGEDGGARVELLRAPGPTPDTKVEEAELHARVRACAARFATTLAARDHDLFRERWLSDEPIPLSRFGEQRGISRERVRQLEARVLERFRAYLARDTGLEELQSAA